MVLPDHATKPESALDRVSGQENFEKFFDRRSSISIESWASSTNR
jgi:hypothetical protein